MSHTEMGHSSTYNDIFAAFLRSTGTNPLQVDDWRPAIAMYTDLPINIPDAIVVWLTDHNKLIFMYK